MKIAISPSSSVNAGNPARDHPKAQMSNRRHWSAASWVHAKSSFHKTKDLEKCNLSCLLIFFAKNVSPNSQYRILRVKCTTLTVAWEMTNHLFTQISRSLKRDAKLRFEITQVLILKTNLQFFKRYYGFCRFRNCLHLIKNPHLLCFVSRWSVSKFDSLIQSTLTTIFSGARSLRARPLSEAPVKSAQRNADSESIHFLWATSEVSLDARELSTR